MPLDTASVQRTVLLSHDPDEIAETLDRWTAYYDADRRAGASRTAAIVLRRRSAGPPNWIHAEKLSQLRARGSPATTSCG